MGPVFVCLPADVLDHPIQESILASSMPSTRVAPSSDDISKAARMLAGAQKPLIIMGDGIAYSGRRRNSNAPPKHWELTCGARTIPK